MSTNPVIDPKAGTAQQPSNEYKVIVPANRDKKRYSILQFNGSLNVDPGHWPQMKLVMAREDNRANTVGPSEIVQDYGEGSEYGRAAREEARRKKYGRQTRKYNPDKQPWQLIVKDPSSGSVVKDRWFRSVCEGGVGANSDHWVFLKSGNNFHAHKVDDWYRFMPNPQKKGLDIDQVEEQFQLRNKVLNQFALKAKIQQTLRDQDEDGGKMSKPNSLKIKDEVSTDDDDNEGDESRQDGEDSSKPKKGQKKKKMDGRERKDKKQRVQNADDVLAYESEDGEDEGREYDYISDSGSNTSREELTVDEKVDQALVAVGDETGMRDDASDEESENENDEEGQDETTKQKRQLLKKLKEQKEAKPDEEVKIRTVDKVERRDSSGSDTDPDEAHSSVLFLQTKARKRPADDEANSGDQAKRTKTNSREQTPSASAKVTQQPATSADTSDGLNEETVRRLLMQRPLSTKDLVSKIKPKTQNMSKEDMVARLAEILRALKPEHIQRTVNKKQVLYFSLAKNN